MPKEWKDKIEKKLITFEWNLSGKEQSTFHFDFFFVLQSHQQGQDIFILLTNISGKKIRVVLLPLKIP